MNRSGRWIKWHDSSRLCRVSRSEEQPIIILLNHTFPAQSGEEIEGA